jgi:hypothetical protein
MKTVVNSSEEDEIEESDIENQISHGLESHSTDDILNIRNRFEEPWTDKTELMLRKWRSQIDKLSDLQEISGYTIKHKHHVIIIPTILIPFIMTFLSQAIPANNPDVAKAISIVNGAMFMITSGLSGLSALYGYGQLYEKHFSYAARYSDLSGRIESVLNSKRKYRLPVDVFVMEIKCNLDSLNENSPKIPLYIIKNYNV